MRAFSATDSRVLGTRPSHGFATAYNPLIAADLQVAFARRWHWGTLLVFLLGAITASSAVVRATEAALLIGSAIGAHPAWTGLLLAVPFVFAGRHVQGTSIKRLESGWLGAAPLAECMFQSAARMRAVLSSGGLALALAAALLPLEVSAHAILMAIGIASAAALLSILVNADIAPRLRRSTVVTGIGGMGLTPLNRWPRTVLAGWLTPPRLAPATAVPLLLLPAGAGAVAALALVAFFAAPIVAALAVLATRSAACSARRLLDGTPYGPRECSRRMSRGGVGIVCACSIGFLMAAWLLGLGPMPSTALAGTLGTIGIAAVVIAANPAPRP